MSNAITVSSVNGAQHTVVNGNGDVTSNRVFYLNDGCVLQGFMVANGQFLEGDGGGVYCVSTNVLIDSCMIMYNGAKNSGGVYGGTLNSCFLLNNSAVNGAGSYGATLNACGLMYNTANGLGGGAYDCIMTDCGILDNAANQSGGGVWGGTLDAVPF